MLKRALGSEAGLQYDIQLGGGLQVTVALLALAQPTVFRVALSIFGLLTQIWVASVFDLTGYFLMHIRVMAAPLRVTVGSAALWFVNDALNDFKHHIVYFLPLIYMLFAPLVVAHVRPSRVVVSASTGGP